MPNEIKDFKSLNNLAKIRWRESRYADAAILYERALKSIGGSEEERLWAKYNLGDCYRMLGRYIEAAACFGEVYSASQNISGYWNLAFGCLYLQLNTIDRLREAEGTNTEANIIKQLRHLDESEQWLRDIGKEEWRHSLLWLRSRALWSLNKKEQSLDAAEEAYRLYKNKGIDGPGYSAATYAGRIAFCSRLLGQYERSLQVLNELEGYAYNPLGQVDLLVERIIILINGSTKTCRIN